MMQALEECQGGHSSSVKPTSPFAQLNKPQNPFQTLPSPIQAKNPFSGNSFNKKPTVNPDSLKIILFSNFDRRKRQADGLIEVTEEDFAEFLADFSDFKDDVASKMSNLTCVLSKMKMLDSNYQVNLKTYTEDFWKDVDLSQTLAGEDPVWRQMMIDGYSDCYDIAKSFPQSALNNNPIMKVWSPHGFLQVHQEGGGSLLRDGLCQPHAGDHVRQHRQLRLEPVRSAQQQVREGRHVHEGHVQHRLARGGIRTQLLLQ